MIKLDVMAPMTGTIKSISKSSDQAYSEKLIGDGVIITPNEGVLVSPVDGKVVQLLDTTHAIMIESEGIKLLMHIGLDTVRLRGRGFKSFVKKSMNVTKGQKLIEFDLELLKKEGYKLESPFVIVDDPEVKIEKFLDDENVIKGETKIMTLTK